MTNLSAIIAPTNVVTTTGTQTLTNKTLTAPTIASANLTTALTLAGAAGTNGQVLTSAGSGLPSWTTISASQWTTSSSDIYYSTGNVGIGTSTAPTARLSATGTTTGFAGALINVRAMQNDGTTLGTPIVLAGHRYLGSQDNNSGVIDVPSSTGRMAMSVNGTVMMAYNTTQMGIGANSFGDLFHRLAVIALNDLGIEVNCGSATATPMTFRSGGGNRGTITTTSGGTAYNTTSDYRLKENVQAMQNALTTVSALKPVTYKWKADNSNGQGFIAHELAEVCPQAVTGQKDAVDANGNPEYQGIDTSFLIATLTAAIQEQQVIINSLKARLDAANL